MTRAVQSRVFVDGNNVMGSRPDGWWRDRAGAARRIVAEIIPLALGHGDEWTIVFDERKPPCLGTQCRYHFPFTGWQVQACLVPPNLYSNTISCPNTLNDACTSLQMFILIPFEYSSDIWKGFYINNIQE